jgi:hypothetical protein
VEKRKKKLEEEKKKIEDKKILKEKLYQKTMEFGQKRNEYERQVE